MVDINKLLLKCEPVIVRVSSHVRPDIILNVRQEMRLRVWRLLEQKYIPTITNSDGLDDVQDFVYRFIYVILKTSVIDVMRANARYHNRFVSFDDIRYFHTLDETYNIFSDDKIDNIFCILSDYRHKITQLMSCLSEDEKNIVTYLLETNNVDTNYESLMRQLGYTGKNSIWNILNRIFVKMRNYAKKHHITASE